MNQIADILKLADEAQQQKIDGVLATVVRTEGSAYRRAGAMMLICEDGRSVGMISGGCLEPHIIKRAFWLTRSGANVQVYQTGNDDTEDDSENDDLDSELNFGLGCNGRVHVLFERLASAAPFLEIIRKVRHTQAPITIATLIRSENADDLPVGMRLDLESYSNTGQIHDLNASHEHSVSKHDFLSDSKFITNTVEALSKHEINKKNAKYVTVKNDSVASEWLIQRLQPQLRLLICGAGNDVMPLVTMAKLQDWHVTVIDSRVQYATRTRFSQADVVMPLSLDDSETLLKLSKNAAVALMSHSLTQDRTRLSILLTHADHYRYLGQLGPRYRTERLIDEISVSKTDPAVLEAGIKKLHYPIGFKLGGDGPEALALSIMAQINAVMYDQSTALGSETLGLSNRDAMSNNLTLSPA